MKDNEVLNTINCKGCKGLIVKPTDYDSTIKNWRSMQMDAINNIKTINLYLLLPFLSPDRFFYDLNTDAWHRNDLKRILLKGSTDQDFLNFLNDRGIVVVECCFCPLHRFFMLGIPFSEIPNVITKCFKRHNLHLLKINKTSPIITLFEESRSFDDKGMPEITDRIIKNFDLHLLERSNKKFRKLLDSITVIKKD